MLLLGPSGGGKSSLLVAIAGLHERSTGATHEGELLVEGRPPRESAAVGIVFQDPESQIVMGRAGDDVAFGLEERCVPPAEIWPRVDRALEGVGFGYGRDRRTEALSGGEQQRLAIASILALEPRILLLDEPTADLDPEGRRLLYELIARLPRDLAIVIVEHRVAEALPLVDRVIAIDGTRGVIADGPRDEVMPDRREELMRSGVWVPDAPVPRSRGGRPASALVEARDASLRYPLSDRATAPATAEAREGEVLGITGPNGSGKTTLLLLLGGLLAPATGTVRAETLDPVRPEPWRWPARVLPARIGSVFQDPDHQFIERRVRDEVLLGPRLSGAEERRAEELMARLGLEALRDANPYTLSGGEKRRLGLAAVLACSPRALLLDEPTYGQDHRTFVEVVRLIAEERDRGVAIAVSTHDALLVDALADRVHEMAAS